MHPFALKLKSWMHPQTLQIVSVNASRDSNIRPGKDDLTCPVTE